MSDHLPSPVATGHTSSVPDLPKYKALKAYQECVPGHRGGSRCHTSTFIRWATKGVKAATGEVVKLRAVRIGSKWLTTDEWFAAFVEATTAAHATPATAPAEVVRPRPTKAQVDEALDALLA